MSTSEDIERDALRTRALDELRTLVVEEHPFLSEIVAVMVECTGAPIAFVSLVNADRQIYLARHGLAGTGVPTALSLCQHAIAQGSILSAPDATADPRLAANPFVAGPDGLRSYIGALVNGADGVAIGTVCVASPQAHAFADTAPGLLDHMSRLVSAFVASKQVEHRAATLQRQLDKEKGQSEIYQLAFDTISEAIHVYDSEGLIVDVNPSSEAILAIPRSELIGQSINSFVGRVWDVHGTPLRAEQLIPWRALRSAEVVRDALIQTEVKGERRWMQISCSPAPGGDGRPHHAIGVFRDVTERRIRDEQLMAALREAEKVRDYARALNTVSEAIAILDADFRLVDCNEGFCRLVGRNRADAQGMELGPSVVARLKPDGAPYTEDELAISRVRQTGQPVRDAIMGIPLASGETRWFAVSASPAGKDSEGGRVERLVVVFRDITESREAEVRLRNALDDARKANAAKSDFLAVMSHELRTPMHAIMGCAQLLAQARLEPSDRSTLGVLLDAGHQLTMLLNDLLDLSGLDNHRLRIEPAPCNLLDVILAAVSGWRNEAQRKGLALHVDLSPGLDAIFLADAVRLQQIVGNLMGNAIKFTREGSVSVRARMLGDTLELTVADTGPGIALEDQTRVFAVFEQGSKGLRGMPGAGIGLHIVRLLSEAMQGGVTLDSRPGEGARFTVWAKTPAQALRAPLPPVEPVAPAPDRRDLDVLCVDDNPRNLLVLALMLTSGGHRVEQADGGEDALRQLMQRRFDVVLLDMLMPDVSGLEVLERLRSQPGPNRDTPVIACTASVLPAQIEVFLKAGCAAVAAKPINIAELLAKVSAVAVGPGHA